MSNKNSIKTTSEPLTRNYAKQVKNKANEKSPYGEDDPSPSTAFKNE
ncbi:hypothetical protein [Clostridium sp.]|jgi:hypothetical protein|nr:hypothetical protein [Clostridium sp.]MDR3597508.1 hypothetical protein [Clostridium sp.]